MPPNEEKSTLQILGPQMSSPPDAPGRATRHGDIQHHTRVKGEAASGALGPFRAPFAFEATQEGATWFAHLVVKCDHPGWDPVTTGPLPALGLHPSPSRGRLCPHAAGGADPGPVAPPNLPSGGEGGQRAVCRCQRRSRKGPCGGAEVGH